MFLIWVLNGKPDETRDCGLYAEAKGETHALSVSPPIEAGAPPTREDIRNHLAGKNLACWCHLCVSHACGKPLGVVCIACEPCHADVLWEVANR